MRPTPQLSIAIPVHNEQEVVAELLRRLGTVLDSIGDGDHEIVIVDDGSTDSTLDLLRQASARDPRLKIVSLSRNFGHQAALSCALDHTSGDAVVVMDADLQDVPEAIPQLYEKFRSGYDVVYAQRIRRKEAWPVRACYFIFYRLLAQLSEVRLPLDAGDFGLMSRRVVDELRSMREHHRYLRGLRAWVGFRQAGIPIERDRRGGGRSKYSWRRLMKLASDGILAFSIVPLRAAALMGLMAIAASVAFAIYSIFVKFLLNRSPLGFTALIVMITFLSGVQLLFLGVIGEYVGRIYEESKGRPLYVVHEVIGQIRETRFPEKTGIRAASAGTSRA
jgi:polyisoprenyl-phosphate glycosyltransferase